MRSLLPLVVGKEIKRVRVLRKESLAFPSVQTFCQAIPGHTFLAIERRGKYLIFKLDKASSLIIHLRMSGRLIVKQRATKLSSHVRVRFLMDTTELVFEDMRVFGRLWYIGPHNTLADVVPHLSRLGVEPLLDLSVNYLVCAFSKSNKSIKTALLDQTIIAGIGNIYADECLHAAGIHPLRRVQTLSASELDNLVVKIRQILSSAIALQGSTLRNYTDAQGAAGSYLNKALVYGREGLPCCSCGSTILRTLVASRSTYYCAFCQPGEP